MFKVMMVVDGESYFYGAWKNRDKANEVAIEVRDSRGVETYVEEA